jgi:hypothetical protein
MPTTGRRSKIELSEEMVDAAKRELLRFDSNYSTAREGAERLLAAALEAGGFEVCFQDSAHS